MASSLCLARRKRREEGGEGHKRHVCLSPPVPSLPSELHRDLENGEEGEVGCVYLKPILSRSKKGKGKGRQSPKMEKRVGGAGLREPEQIFQKWSATHTHTQPAHGSLWGIRNGHSLFLILIRGREVQAARCPWGPAEGRRWGAQRDPPSPPPDTEERKKERGEEVLMSFLCGESPAAAAAAAGKRAT